MTVRTRNGMDGSEDRATLLPLHVDLRGRKVVVVGAGAVGERRTRLLLEAGAQIVVVAPRCAPFFERQAKGGHLELKMRTFEPGDLAGATLVVAATDDETANAAIGALAKARGILHNDAGDARRGDVVIPAVHRTGSLTFSVGTGGLSPAFSKRLRTELAARFGPAYGRAAETLGRVRTYVQAVVPPELRAAALGTLGSREVEELARMNPAEAEHAIDRAVEELQTRGDGGQTPRTTLTCASRGSALATIQARFAMAKLAETGIASTLLAVATKGDRVQDRSLASLGTESIFVQELELALRERRADYAVHSCKDLPTSLPPDMHIAAISAREDPRDAYCSERYATFGDLPAGARVGTSSPRRHAQLAAMRPDLEFRDIRGNVDTRLRKLAAGEYDAIVVAMAGLLRLGARATHTVPFGPDELTPAVGQGALAIECRADDAALALTLHEALASADAELAVSAERALLRELRGGCQAPIGAHATYLRGALDLRAVVAARDGSTQIRGRRNAAVASVALAEACAVELARELLERGAGALLEAARATPQPLEGTLLVLARTQERSSRIAPALRSAGAVVLEASDSVSLEKMLSGRLPDVILFPSSGSVTALSGYLESLRESGRRPGVAAMGPSSANGAAACGFAPDVVAASADVASFVQTVTRYVLERKA